MIFYVLLICTLSVDTIFPRIPFQKTANRWQTSAAFQRMIQKYKSNVEDMYVNALDDELDVIVRFRSEQSAKKAVTRWNKLKTYESQKAQVLI